MKRLVLTLLALGLAAPAAAQQVYKWVDEDGTVHFTDSPPEERVNAERVRLAGNVSTVLPEAEERGVSSDEIDLLYTPEQRAQACEQARANATTLRNMPIVTKDLDGDGTPERLTDEQKADELRRAEQQVALLCADD